MHRLGQQAAQVHVTRFLVRGTIEEDVYTQGAMRVVVNKRRGPLTNEPALHPMSSSNQAAGAARLCVATEAAALVHLVRRDVGAAAGQ